MAVFRPRGGRMVLTKAVSTQTKIDAVLLDKASEYFDQQAEEQWRAIAWDVVSPASRAQLARLGLPPDADIGSLAAMLDDSDKSVTVALLIEKRVRRMQQGCEHQVQALRRRIAELEAHIDGGSGPPGGEPVDPPAADDAARAPSGDVVLPAAPLQHTADAAGPSFRPTSAPAEAAPASGGPDSGLLHPGLGGAPVGAAPARSSASSGERTRSTSRHLECPPAVTRGAECSALEGHRGRGTSSRAAVGLRLRMRGSAVVCRLLEQLQASNALLDSLGALASRPPAAADGAAAAGSCGAPPASRPRPEARPGTPSELPEPPAAAGAGPARPSSAAAAADRRHQLPPIGQAPTPRPPRLQPLPPPANAAAPAAATPAAGTPAAAAPDALASAHLQGWEEFRARVRSHSPSSSSAFWRGAAGPPPATPATATPDQRGPAAEQRSRSTGRLPEKRRGSLYSARSTGVPSSQPSDGATTPLLPEESPRLTEEGVLAESADEDQPPTLLCCIRSSRGVVRLGTIADFDGWPAPGSPPPPAAMGKAGGAVRRPPTTARAKPLTALLAA